MLKDIDIENAEHLHWWEEAGLSDEEMEVILIYYG